MLNPDDYAVIDFETEAIQPRPDYPPTPVGVSILENGVAKYYKDNGTHQHHPNQKCELNGNQAGL